MAVPAHPRLAARLAMEGVPRYIVAAQARMTPNDLGGIISGRRRPSPGQRERIAAVLGTTVEALFDDLEVGAQ